MRAANLLDVLYTLEIPLAETSSGSRVTAGTDAVLLMPLTIEVALSDVVRLDAINGSRSPAH